MAELNATNYTVINSFLWGSDLSGSMQGAGGVGGLLVVSNSASGSHFVSYDGSGNIVGLMSATNGAISAQYEYGPFGEVIRASGSMASANPFRFSTKYQDEESGLVYYGYRYYNASIGSWLNRDPLGEMGGLNIFAFAFNDPANRIDLNGLLVASSIAVGAMPAAEVGTTTLVTQAEIDAAMLALKASGSTAVPLSQGVLLTAGSATVVPLYVAIPAVGAAGALGYGAGLFIGGFTVGGATIDQHTQRAYQALLDPYYAQNQPATIPPDVRRRARQAAEPEPSDATVPLGTEEKERNCHRGRFQAQGNGTEKSQPWAQPTPLTLGQGRALFATLVSRLSDFERKQRTSAIIVANEFMTRSAAANGIGPMKKSFLEVKFTLQPSSIQDPKHTRIDIEVSEGRAFVP